MQRSGVAPGTWTSLLEQLPVPVLLLTPDGRLSCANAAARVLLGLRDEPGGADGPDLGCLADLALPGALAHGTWTGAVGLTGPGGPIDAEVSVSALEGCAEAGFAVVIRGDPAGPPADDRARLLAEVIDQSTEFVAWHGPIGAEARINPAGAALVGGGVTANAPLPTRVRDLFVEEDTALINRVGVPEMERAGSWRARLRIRNRDSGDIRQLDFSMFLVRGADGRVLGSAGMGRDVTDQAQTILALEKAHAELSALYEQMRELHEQRSELMAKVNQELTASDAAARAASAAKTEFLSRMSHELRTPMNAVLGFAQLLELDLGEEHHDKVGQIRRAGTHLLELINDVLDISSIESGQLMLSVEAVRVADLVSEVVDLMTPIAEQRQVELSKLGAECDCCVRADRRRAKQVLLNLVSNAVKYNNPGGSVRLRCRASTDGRTVRIAVQDDGIGIPAEHLGRLFVPFERLAAAGTEIEGSGVGLALSKRLATAMGGSIEVRSSVGRGSTFTFVLPAEAEPARAAGAAAPPEAAPAQPAPGDPGCVVLSVEDNLINSQLLEHIVGRRPGWTIVHAALGQLGLDLAHADPPDLVLLDLHLPDLSGKEVLQRMKTSPRTRHVPVAILSADATPGQADRLCGLGADVYLTKPLDVQALLDLLDAVAAARKATS